MEDLCYETNDPRIFSNQAVVLYTCVLFFFANIFFLQNFHWKGRYKFQINVPGHLTKIGQVCHTQKEVKNAPESSIL